MPLFRIPKSTSCCWFSGLLLLAMLVLSCSLGDDSEDSGGTTSDSSLVVTNEFDGTELNNDTGRILKIYYIPSTPDDSTQVNLTDANQVSYSLGTVSDSTDIIQIDLNDTAYQGIELPVLVTTVNDPVLAGLSQQVNDSEYAVFLNHISTEATNRALEQAQSDAQRRSLDAGFTVAVDFSDPSSLNFKEVTPEMFNLTGSALVQAMFGDSSMFYLFASEDFFDRAAARQLVQAHQNWLDFNAEAENTAWEFPESEDSWNLLDRHDYLLHHGYSFFSLYESTIDTGLPYLDEDGNGRVFSVYYLWKFFSSEGLDAPFIQKGLLSTFAGLALDDLEKDQYIDIVENAGILLASVARQNPDLPIQVGAELGAYLNQQANLAELADNNLNNEFVEQVIAQSEDTAGLNANQIMANIEQAQELGSGIAEAGYTQYNQPVVTSSTTSSTTSTSTTSTTTSTTQTIITTSTISMTTSTTTTTLPLHCSFPPSPGETREECNE